MDNSEDAIFMHQAIELAKRGIGQASPNPMVGALIVCQGSVIGEGWHKRYGESHAEVNAINSVENRSLLPQSTIYITLEPCSHWGKTPPCSQLIIAQKFKRVVIGCVDPNPRVSGRGIREIQEAGIDVEVGILEQECRWLNRRFFTAQTQKRPYIVLKWAETIDGYVDVKRPSTLPPAWMTGIECRRMVHQWRTEEDAIIVGRKTVELDNPSLTVRDVEGRNPLRVTLDRELKLNVEFQIFNNDAPTLLITDSSRFEQAQQKFVNQESVEIQAIDYRSELLPQLMDILMERGVNSLFVEGGAELLQSFIDGKLWDEARIFISATSSDQLYPTLKPPIEGILAPQIQGRESAKTRMIDEVKLLEIFSKKSRVIR